MCSELCIRAVFDRSVRQTVADKCYFPMYYSHVHSDVLRYIALYYSHSHSYTPLYYSHDNAVQRNALSFVHFHSVAVITARQTVADPCFVACMARSVWPCLYGAICMALFVWQRSHFLVLCAHMPSHTCFLHTVHTCKVHTWNPSSHLNTFKHPCSNLTLVPNLKLYLPEQFLTVWKRPLTPAFNQC